MSRGPAAGLNLATHVADDPVAVAENRARLLAALPAGVGELVVADQVHGREVAQVRAGDPSPTADALVTTEPGLALAVVVADCVPVLVLDGGVGRGPGAGGPVGVAHAGRRGMDLGVVPALVSAVRDLGAIDPVAVLGPSVCGRCYEVPLALRDDVASRHRASWATTAAGTPALDVAAGVLAQLATAGVPALRVPGCTREDDRLFSVRRDGAATGRGAGVVWRDAHR